MKFAVFLSILLVGWSLAVLPDQLGYDVTTTSPWYQTCKTGNSANSYNTYFSGTACVVFNPQSRNYQYYVNHNLPTAGFTVTIVLCNTDGFCSTSTIARPNVQSGPFAPLTGSVQLTTGAAPSSIALTTTHTVSGGALTESFSFSNVYNYNKAPGQPGTRELTGVTGNKDGSGYKFAPTYVESFVPMYSFVLLSRLPNSKNLNVRSTAFNMVVVAVGSGVTNVAEGDIVQVIGAYCLKYIVKLNANPANTDDVLALSPYCSVPAATILGKVSESNYGANRAFVGMGHIKQAQSSSWMMSTSNAFTKLTV